MTSKKDMAWNKTKPIRGRNPEVWGKDPQGNTIRKPSYGTHGDYGWHLDHKKPKSKGGSDSPKNLQPLHWEANIEKSDKYRPPKKHRK